MFLRVFFFLSQETCVQKVVMQNFNNYNNLYTPPNFHGLMPQVQQPPLREKCPNTKFFWSEYRKIGTRKNAVFWTLFAQCTAIIFEKCRTSATRRKNKFWYLCGLRSSRFLESSRYTQVWSKLVNKVCSLCPAKTIKQCQVKIRNLKDAYKKYKEENKHSKNQRRSLCVLRKI